MKRILIIGAVVLVGGLGFAYALYNKPHQNIKKQEAAFELPAGTFLTEFETDETSANGKYLDKVVQVNGVVEDFKVDEQGVTSVRLKAGDGFAGVVCQLDELTEHERLEFKKGETVTFKGICTGMLMDVVLVRCIEV
ncbi:MAG: hypothetical protein KDC44_22170 [Phaeodactylibacter sp.]|nr:hypothetical protein [Phaeodactylibacter sp.]